MVSMHTLAADKNLHCAEKRWEYMKALTFHIAPYFPEWVPSDVVSNFCDININ